MKNYNQLCEHEETFREAVGPHMGLYCKICGRWIKWLNKTELKLLKYLEKSED